MNAPKLLGFELDRAVAEAEHFEYRVEVSPGGLFYIALGAGGWQAWSPSTNWAIGGPIIERELIGVAFYYDFLGNHDPDHDRSDCWRAEVGSGAFLKLTRDLLPFGEGPTALIAAMRAFVSSRAQGNRI